MPFSRVTIRTIAEEQRLKRQEAIDRKRQRDLNIPMLLPDTSFVAAFRLTKQQYAGLCEELIGLMPPSIRTTAVRPEIKILAALHFFASGGYQGHVGGDRMLCISQTTTSDCIAQVTNILNSEEMLSKYIKFPRTDSARMAVSQRFYEKFGFPGVLGCIDGTHCAIIRPKDSEEAYFNRKNYHSLNVLVVCDADLKILHVDASFGGASHDSFVWNACPIKLEMEQLLNAGQHFWLLGDSGYAQRPWLMTPILNAAPDTAEEYYTRRHCSTRNVVERCFGVLKSRFRCLLAHRVLHYDPVKAGKIFNACVVLHNFINDGESIVDEEAMALDGQLQPSLITERETAHNSERQALVNRLWRSRQQ